MAAETAKNFDVLEAQAQRLMSVFTKAGYEAVAPAIIQPADVFLDVIGESLRARTYVFNDPDGAELCLRPDLTVPTCRLHLARCGDQSAPARYCYNGPAFRYQPLGVDAAHPREFRQAGVERFGDIDGEAAEADVIALIVKAIETAGVSSWTLRIGDVGLFSAVLDAAELPERYKKRLDAAFWRPQTFHAEIERLMVPSAIAESVPENLMASLTPGNPGLSAQAIQTYLESNGIEVFGVRTIEEVTGRLLDLHADATAPPLDRSSAALIADYVAISGPVRKVGSQVAALLRASGKSAGKVLETFDRRLALLANAGIDLDRAMFAAEFGRNLDYYTGLVFEILSPRLDPRSPIASGGRYDRLMRSAGASKDLAAVGAAIHTERLLSVVSGGAA